MKNINWTGLLLFVLFFTVIFSYRYFICKHLFRTVQSCANYNYGFNIDSVIRLSNGFSSQYRLTTNEMNFAREILSEYQKHIVDAYFNETLLTKLVFFNMPSETYFMYSLFEFLHSHAYECTFHDHSMRTFVSMKKSVKIYSFTDFGVTYFKLYIMACAFCESNNYLTKKNLFHYNSVSIKKCLDKGIIEI